MLHCEHGGIWGEWEDWRYESSTTTTKMEPLGYTFFFFEVPRIGPQVLILCSGILGCVQSCVSRGHPSVPKRLNLGELCIWESCCCLSGNSWSCVSGANDQLFWSWIICTTMNIRWRWWWPCFHPSCSGVVFLFCFVFELVLHMFTLRSWLEPVTFLCPPDVRHAVVETSRTWDSPAAAWRECSEVSPKQQHQAQYVAYWLGWCSHDPSELFS